MIVPDPIPFVDEFIMWAGLFMHLYRLMSIAEFIQNHKKAVLWVSIGIALVILLVILVLII